MLSNHITIFIYSITKFYVHYQSKRLHFVILFYYPKTVVIYFFLQNYSDDHMHSTTQDDELDLDEEHAQIILERYSSQNVRQVCRITTRYKKMIWDSTITLVCCEYGY